MGVDCGRGAGPGFFNHTGGIVKPYYEEPGIVIYHGDCRDILPELPKVDLVLTDPPYGIGADKTMSKQSGQKFGKAKSMKSFYEKTDWDSKPIPQETINSIINHGKEAILWGGNYYSMPPSSCWLVWDKENGDNGFADCELAWTNMKKAVRMKKHLWNGMLRKGKEDRNGHPTQKPIELISWCIRQAEEPQTILDPFMGSGTTLRAAKDLNRKAIGIEQEEKYCKIAVKRLAQEVMQF